MTSASGTAASTKRYVSERGPFEIVANPEMSTGYTWEGVDAHEAVKNWEIGRLAERYGDIEIRSGPGVEGAPGMVIHEHSLDSIQRIIDQANAHRHEWHAPKAISGTALRQAEKLLEVQGVG